MLSMPYHAGIIVPDIARATQELTRKFGYTFNAPTTIAIPEVEDRVGGYTRAVDLVAAYSCEGPFRLEVIASQGEGVYSARLSGLHHLGVWESDPAERLRQLEADGEQVDAIIRRSDGGISAIYARAGHLAGTRVEYVNDDRRQQLEAWFETGIMPG
ncbi:VOC family protein [Nocardia alni]|uniref:VOC family protein n=1 Tax=Nocardia alni TaxID=2815723 RepID=UPI001C22ECBD|nr:VOC family protein [Nocardia alni]